MFNQNFIFPIAKSKNCWGSNGNKKRKESKEDISTANYKNLSWGDRQRLDQLLAQRD